MLKLTLRESVNGDDAELGSSIGDGMSKAHTEFLNFLVREA